MEIAFLLRLKSRRNQFLTGFRRCRRPLVRRSQLAFGKPLERIFRLSKYVSIVSVSVSSKRRGRWCTSGSRRPSWCTAPATRTTSTRSTCASATKSGSSTSATRSCTTFGSRCSSSIFPRTCSVVGVYRLTLDTTRKNLVKRNRRGSNDTWRRPNDDG